MLRLGADIAYGRGIPDMANQLRIESANGAPIADYRVFEGYVEVRPLNFSRLHLFETTGRWKRLTPTEITAHVKLCPVLGYWLRSRFENESDSDAVGERGSSCHPGGLKPPSLLNEC